MRERLEQISDLVDRHAQAPVSACALPRVTLIRVDDAQDVRTELFVAVVCLVAQGRKEVRIGERSETFVPGTLTVSGLTLPSTGQVIKAPYRAVAIHLASCVLADLVLDDTPPTTALDAVGFEAVEATEALVDAMFRLLQLLDDEKGRSVLADAAEREVLYRALQTPSGAVIRRFAREGHLASRVDPAIVWIREHIAETLSVDDLAELCHVSTSTFFRHFRAATARTPLQFQKQIRLQEARKLLFVGKMTAAGAAACVGYASATQFSREYARMFGIPPGQDAAGYR